MHKQRFPSHSELAGEKILESIYEIYANAVSHGETKYVYSCGEYKEMTCVLDMTIVDCGVTIPMKVNDFYFIACSFRFINRNLQLEFKHWKNITCNVNADFKREFR